MAHHEMGHGAPDMTVYHGADAQYAATPAGACWRAA